MEDALTAPQKNEVALALSRAHCVTLGDYRLECGKRSPVYVNLRPLQSSPLELLRVAHVFAEVTRKYEPDRYVAIPHGATPLTTAISLCTGIGMLTARPERKEHGIDSLFDGNFTAGMKVIIIDDVITTGGSKAPP